MDAQTSIPPDQGTANTGSGDTATRPPKPVALAVSPGGIPAELKARLQWVCWRYVWLPDKRRWDKPPINARTGGGASHSEPATWSSFETAFSAYQRHGYDGIGFVVHKNAGTEDSHPGDPLVVFDLDKCRDPATGAIQPWAQEVVAEVQSYTEPSVSRTGIRVFAKGRLPPNGRRKKRFEVYETLRYATVNGHHLPGTPGTVEERQQAISAVHARIFGNGQSSGPFTVHAEDACESLGDGELMERARRAKNGQKFIALYDRGDWKSLGIYPSPSEADEGLCCLLVWWLNRDPARVDAAFRQSRMYRPKWDRKDYRERTIKRALEKVSGCYQDGSGHPPDLKKPTGYEIILAHFRAKYEGTFRRDTALYSGRLAREVKIGEACAAPGMTLIKKLARARDAPRDNDGKLKSGALPYFFATWAKSAWIDYLDSLPAEEAAEEVSDPAQEQFRARVRAGLLHPYTLGERHERTGETHTERLPVIGWAARFANDRGWGDVRGLEVWHRRQEGRMLVALRVELFGQIGCKDLFPDVTQNKLARLCELYGVGSSHKPDGSDFRVRGKRAVLLDPEFVAELLGDPQAAD